jgi:hypothetical protein
MPDAELSADWVAGSLAPLARNGDRLAQLGSTARSLVAGDAAARLAGIVLETALEEALEDEGVRDAVD